MGWIGGIDVGGTFTDLIGIEPAEGKVALAKVPTTLDNQAFGVLAALEKGGIALADTDTIVHGATTTTNALLERKVARLGLITTRGFPTAWSSAAAPARSLTARPADSSRAGRGRGRWKSPRARMPREGGGRKD